MDKKAKEESIRAVVGVLSCVLKQLCTKNDQVPNHQRVVTKFHALRPPAISIYDYLTRVAKYSACSPECFVLSLVYIDRIIQSNPQFVVDSLNIHRLLITSIMLSAKFFDDQYYNNSYYAKVGGVSAHEMNSLEVEFLFMANFTLFVSTETYSQYYFELSNHAANGNCGCASIRVPPLVLPNFHRARQLVPSPSSSSSLDHPTAFDLPPFNQNCSKFTSPQNSSSSSAHKEPERKTQEYRRRRDTLSAQSLTENDVMSANPQSISPSGRMDSNMDSTMRF